MRRDWLIPVAGLGIAAVLALGGALTAWQVGDDEGGRARRGLVVATLTTITTTFDPATQYLGRCAVVTPPAPDPCDAANGTLRYAALYEVQLVPYYAKWTAANPGEVQRLAGLMAAPQCSDAPTGTPSVMLTHYGMLLQRITEAIACAKHPEPIVWPEIPPPPDPNRTDKTPPTAPGPITVGP